MATTKIIAKKLTQSKATAEIIPETMTENLESFATDNTEKIEEDSFDVGLVNLICILLKIKF